MNAQTICFSGRLSVGVWWWQLSEWPRLEWWSWPPLFLSAAAVAVAALWALTRALTPPRTPIRWEMLLAHRRTESGWLSWSGLGESWRKWNVVEMNERMDSRDVELKRVQGVRLVGALCRWMRIWDIVCQPICSSVGEVVRSRSQGRGPEGQERKVRAASRTEEGERMRGKCGKMCSFAWLLWQEKAGFGREQQGWCMRMYGGHYLFKKHDLSYTICLFIQHFPI